MEHIGWHMGGLFCTWRSFSSAKNRCWSQYNDGTSWTNHWFNVGATIWMVALRSVSDTSYPSCWRCYNVVRDYLYKIFVRKYV